MKDVIKSSRRRKGQSARETAVSEAAKRLREIILEKGDGAFLGSRDDLVQTLGVGHVTLQQAARLLERERLLFVRRGANGGYFARIPDETGVEEVVATYLRARHVGFREAHGIASVLEAEMARLAARSDNEAARKDLAAVGERIAAADLSDPAELLRLSATYSEIVNRMAVNPLGELVLLVTLRLFFEAGPGSLLRTPDDAEEWRRSRVAIIRAILDRDEEVVQIYCRRSSKRTADKMESPLQWRKAPAGNHAPTSRRRSAASLEP